MNRPLKVLKHRRIKFSHLEIALEPLLAKKASKIGESLSFSEWDSGNNWDALYWSKSFSRRKSAPASIASALLASEEDNCRILRTGLLNVVEGRVSSNVGELAKRQSWIHIVYVVDVVFSKWLGRCV